MNVIEIITIKPAKLINKYPETIFIIIKLRTLINIIIYGIFRSKEFAEFIFIGAANKDKTRLNKKPKTHQQIKFCKGILPPSQSQKPLTNEAKGSSIISVANIITDEIKQTAIVPVPGNKFTAIRYDETVTLNQANAIAGGTPDANGCNVSVYEYSPNG